MLLGPLCTNLSGTLSRRVIVYRIPQWRFVSSLADGVASQAGREEDPITRCSHRSLEVRRRDANKRSTRAVRRSKLWIPAFLEGRGKITSTPIQVRWSPLYQDLLDGRFTIQCRPKLQGPLYELCALNRQEDPVQYPFSTPATPELPFVRIRALIKNMTIHPLTQRPVSATFVVQPVEEVVRVRVPIRFVNEEKCIGLKNGGWMNEVISSLEIRVDPFVEPPSHCELDVEDMDVSHKRKVGDVMFNGKGKGCEAILAPDTVVTIMSRR